MGPSSPSSLVPLSPASTHTQTSTFDPKRYPRHKETQFVYKHGQKHHSYDNEKAPYPLSYDRDVIELESLDNRLAQHLRGSVSFVNFSETPQRTLDLGCGTGTWVINAAKEWPDCDFVGFDLVNIQIPLQLLETSLATRIQWKHGNYLSTKLPFEDDVFDHVHIQSIAKGVPENKWGILFEEVSRVLRPGGSVEMIEDDVVFPTLPQWFTGALRVRLRRTPSIHLPDGSQRGFLSSRTSLAVETSHHDHALLESLNRSVYENRFINMNPTAVLPSYFTTYFRRVTMGPVINFPVPPYAPPLPLPQQANTSYATEPTIDTPETSPSTFSAPSSNNRPSSVSFSSTVSTSSTAESSTNTSLFSLCLRTTSDSTSSHAHSPDSSLADSQILQNVHSPLKRTRSPLKRFMLDGSLSESEIAALPPSLFPIGQLEALSERSLAMQLYRSYQSVLACQEAMWDELKDRIRNRKEELLFFGWDDDEELEELQSRKKFEVLISRYQSDMHARISLWSSLTDLGLRLPTREPLTKAELIEEERKRESIMEARKHVTAEDLETPCRSLRVLVGYKD